MRDGAVHERGEPEHESEQLAIRGVGAGDDPAHVRDDLQHGRRSGVVVSPDLVLEGDARLAFGARGDGAHRDVGGLIGERAGVDACGGSGGASA